MASGWGFEGKAASKRYVLNDANRVPLALRLTGVNVHDSTVLEAVVDNVPLIRQAPRKPGDSTLKG